MKNNSRNWLLLRRLRGFWRSSRRSKSGPRRRL